MMLLGKNTGGIKCMVACSRRRKIGGSYHCVLQAHKCCPESFNEQMKLLANASLTFVVLLLCDENY